MKVLVIDSLFFKLPDDFNGGFADALRAMADYHEQPQTAERRTRGEVFDSSLSWRKMRDRMWGEFLEAASEGNRLFGSISLGETEGKKLVLLDVNTGAPKKLDTTSSLKATTEVRDAECTRGLPAEGDRCR